MKRNPVKSEPTPICGYLSMAEKKIKVSSCRQNSNDYGMICVTSKYKQSYQNGIYGTVTLFNLSSYLEKLSF